MCEFLKQLEEVTKNYSNEKLGVRGREVFNSMPIDGQVRFILNHQ